MWDKKNNYGKNETKTPIVLISDCPPAMRFGQLHYPKHQWAMKTLGSDQSPTSQKTENK